MRYRLQFWTPFREHPLDWTCFQVIQTLCGFQVSGEWNILWQNLSYFLSLHALIKMPFTPSGPLVVPWGTFKPLFLAYFRHSFEICSLLAKNENMDSIVLKRNSSALGRQKWLLQAKSKVHFFSPKKYLYYDTRRFITLFKLVEVWYVQGRIQDFKKGRYSSMATTRGTRNSLLKPYILIK